MGLMMIIIQLYAFRGINRLGGDPFPPRNVMLPGGGTVVPTGVPTTTIPTTTIPSPVDTRLHVSVRSAPI